MDKERQKKPINDYRRKQLMFVWGWLAIPIIAWVVFYWYLNLSSFVGAFQDRDGFWTLQNFKDVWIDIFNPSQFARSSSLAVGFKNTLSYFLLTICVEFPIQIVTCYFLYKQIWGYKFFRYIFYLPAIISGIVLTTVFQAFIDPDIGAIQEIVKMFNPEFQMPTLMGSPDTATKTIMTYVIWTCVCGNMLLVCGAMNRIPVDVLEAARLDGIGPGRELINIILPLIWPTLSTLLILTCTGFLSASGPILLFNTSAADLEITTISYWIWDKVYATSSTGNIDNGVNNLVSAAGLMLTVVAVPIILAIRKLLDLVPSVEY